MANTIPPGLLPLTQQEIHKVSSKVDRLEESLSNQKRENEKKYEPRLGICWWFVGAILAGYAGCTIQSNSKKLEQTIPQVRTLEDEVKNLKQQLKDIKERSNTIR